MTPASTKDKKGSKKKEGTQAGQADVGGESQLIAEVERQIQEEREKAQEEESTQGDMSRVDEMEIGDTAGQGSKTMNNNSVFSFEAMHVPSRDPVTPIKFSEKPNFLKRSINDLLFTPEPLTKKNPRVDSSLLNQILSKLETLSGTRKSNRSYCSFEKAERGTYLPFQRTYAG